MTWFRTHTGNGFPERQRAVGRRIGSIVGFLALLALLVVGCGPAPAPTATQLAAPADTSTPTASPLPAPTDAPAATASPLPAPTDAPMPTSTPLPEPTDAPTPEPTATVTDTPAPEASPEPSVLVADQELVDGTVTVAEVLSDGPGWLVIHAQADGNPGPILGYSPVASGPNNDVVVELDLSAATRTLYAMLHTDAGMVGTWEFPDGPDVPVTVDGQVVSPAFNLHAAAGEAEVEMEDFQFNPKTLVITIGTTVKWGNRDEVIHTTTSDNDVWDSGSVAEGEEFSFTFTEPGIYPYYCIPHGAPGGTGMAGTIIVLQ
jgi:plastocyanin